MEVFLCWSGRRSLAVAEALHLWLPQVVDGVRPFLSKDIAKGEMWFGSLAKKLKACRSVVVCLTPENLQAPWIHFEVGAVSQRFVSGQVFPYLLDLEGRSLQEPLRTFQATHATEPDTKLLVEAVAKAHGGDPAAELAGARFSRAWPELRRHLEEIDPLAVSDIVPGFADLFAGATFREPLEHRVDNAWQTCLRDVAETLGRLRAHTERVVAGADRYLADRYRQLIADVDGYAAAFSPTLVTSRTLESDGRGRLIDSTDALLPAEERRTRVLHILKELQQPRRPPVLPSSPAFESEELAQRRLIVRELQGQLMFGQRTLSEEERHRIRVRSEWELDRIALYLTLEREPPTSALVEELCWHVRTEVERVEGRPEGLFLLPLHYALRALRTLLQRDPLGRTPAVRPTLAKVEQFVGEDVPGHGASEIREELTGLQRLARTADRVVLEFGQSGPDVQRWQQQLRRWSSKALRQWGADGRFGQETLEWTRMFQRSAGLAPDGRVGQSTRDAMAKVLGRRG